MTDLIINSTVYRTDIESRLNQRRHKGGTNAVLSYLHNILGDDQFTDEYLDQIHPHLTTDEIDALAKFREDLAEAEAQQKIREEAREKARVEAEKARAQAQAKAAAIEARKITLLKLVEDSELFARVSADAKKNGWTVEHQVMLENLTVDQETRGNYIFGLNWRKVCHALGITHQELNRWVDDGTFPPADGVVDSYYFTSMSYSKPCVDAAWLPETIVAVKPMIEQWRADHKAKVKADQKEQARLRRQAKKNAEAVEGQASI